MKVFLNGLDEQFEEMRQRATGACVRFVDAELPPGAFPKRGTVGIEIDRSTGLASLLVQRGIHYSGSSLEISEWLRRGEKVFPTFDLLRRWIATTLTDAFLDLPASGVNAVRRRKWLTRTTSPILKSLERTCRARVLIMSPTATSLPNFRARPWTRRCPSRIVAARQPTLGQNHSTTAINRFSDSNNGVGKPKSAEMLPIVLRELDPAGAGFAYLRIDCSEMREAHRVSQLLGAPPSYVGYGDGSQ